MKTQTWIISVIVIAAIIALIVFIPYVNRSKHTVMPKATLIDGVEFSPSIKWPFEIEAASSEIAETSLADFIEILQSELRLFEVELHDVRDSQGCLMLQVPVPDDARQLSVRLAVIIRSTVQSDSAEHAVKLRCSLYANFATFQRLDTIDRQPVAVRLHRLANEVKHAALSASVMIPEIKPR